VALRRRHPVSHFSLHVSTHHSYVYCIVLYAVFVGVLQLSDLLFHPDRMIGGLRGVVYTEVVQTVVLVVGAVLVLLFGLHEVGGVSEFKARLPDSYFHMIRPASDPVLGPLCCGRAQLSGGRVLRQRTRTGVSLDGHRLGLSGHCLLVLVHGPGHRAARAGCQVRRPCPLWYVLSPSIHLLVSSRSYVSVKGTILASFFKLLPLFLLVIPGMVHFFCFCCFLVVVRFC